ncbi:hypothetical protein AB4K20DRAFT_1908782, partial [Rhizopus microsporus]
MVCKDCQETGHANKSYYKCKYYKEASAGDGDSLLYAINQRLQEYAVYFSFNLG